MTMDRMANTAQPRVIKRYANRKLYDMSESCYITHDEIANLVEAGEEVRIIDNKTKEDLTTRTLTQILFEKEKRNRRTLPLQTLRGLFQTSGDFIQRQIVQPVTTLREEAEGTVRKIIKRGKDEAETDPDGTESTAAVSDSAANAPSAREDAASDEFRKKGPESLKEFMDNSSRAVENLQATLEQRWNLIMNSIGHFDLTSRRIAELEERVAELEANIAALQQAQEK